MASQSWSSSSWIRIGCSDGVVACLVFAIAAAGFYAPGIPLIVGVAGLAFVTLTRNRHRRFAIAFGWHAAAFLPVWTGFLNLQIDFSIPVALLLAFPAVVALAFAFMNAGIAVALGLTFPWYVGSPTLIAGDLWPGTGVVGILLVPLLLTGLDVRSLRVQTATAVGASIASICCWLVHEPVEAKGFSEVEIWPSPALTTASLERHLFDALPSARVVFLGENVLDRSNSLSIDRWCEYAAARQTVIYAGVIEMDGRSTIYRFDHDGGCRPEQVHERTFAMPAVTGDWNFGWSVGAGSRRAVYSGPYRVRWLICFSVFSPMAWILHTPESNDVIVVAANDYWTQPVPMEIARSKVGQSMARLWDVTAVSAETTSRVGVFGS